MPGTKTSSSNTSSQIVFDILRELCKTDRPLGVAEIHRIIDEPTSSTHRALMTLEEAGLAARFGRQIKFGPGPMVQNLVRAMIARFNIRRQGIHLLNDIAKLTEAPATLNARLGWYSIRVGWVEGRHELYDQRRIGQTRLLHEMVAPITMLSTCSDAEISEYRNFVRQAHPDQVEAANDPAVDRMISLGRKRGFLVKIDPRSESGRWVSFPLLGPAGSACGAVTLAMDSDKIPRKGEHSELTDQLTELVRSFQQHLDHHPKETETPYDYMPRNDIRMTLSRESPDNVPAAN